MIRRRTELEQAYDCIDRGSVSPFTDDEGRRWIESCARCYHHAHIVIMRKTGARLKACPRCLVLLGEGQHYQEKPLAVRNRIAKYMRGESNGRATEE